ncbi:hypothetical protein [Streptomyces boluensis]|uniref:Uncharacterized protein n=1 Tax=Streptomyces boluensis TaxID=1775135 RepID=A0A964UW40_9ACTN|nr:hypothetical protein [Streptomyces boluensis]NBE52695.1 hypothetical protein [Streptomyces boluensis]
MSLVELIAQADERGLAASALACLDRCLPLLGGADDEVLRPLWASLEGGDWGAELDRVRAAFETVPDDEGAALARRMLAAAPDRLPSDVRVWADGCSAAALQVHRLLDGADDGTDGPLTAGEHRRQVRVLELLATPGGGLRQALDVSTEGRRIVRAVVSRRARVRG